MAGPRAWLVLAVLTLAALAGCIRGGDDAQVPAGTATNVTRSNATCFGGGCGDLIAFEETNATEAGVGGVDHHHDYWAGRERVEIFKTEAMMEPLGSGNAQGYRATATFRPPQGTFIFEATQSVEFTISNPQRHYCEGEFTFGGFYICHDNLDNHSTSAPQLPAVPDPTGGPSGLKLRYKHASTVEWIEVGELSWGKALPIKITDPRQTDMPHATSSAWEFQVISPNAHDSTLKFDAKAEIVRGPVGIPLWPGHPNFYSDTPARKVLEKQVVACDTNACKLPGNEKAGPVYAERLVSYGTRTIYVWVNITDVFAPNPALAPSNWFLYHWNSTGRDNITDPFDANHSADKKSHLWILPVDDNGMDSPYADGSRWRFMLGGSVLIPPPPAPPTLSCYGGCGDWAAKYTITVIATNHSLPLEEVEMYCLRDDYCPTPEDAATNGIVTTEQRLPDGTVRRFARHDGA